MRNPQSKNEVIGQCRQLIIDLFRRQGTVNAQVQREITACACHIAELESRVAELEDDADVLRRNLHGALVEAGDADR